MAEYLIFFLLSFFLVYLLIPLTAGWAKRLNILDRPGKRKVHHAPIPLSGGVAVYLGVLVSLLMLEGFSSVHLAAVAGGLPLVLIGILDDRTKSLGKDFPALPKLLVQAGAASLAFLAGIRLEGVGDFFTRSGSFIAFPLWLSFLATLLWIIGLVNMINFLDGLDGLAGGVTAISGAALFLTAFFKNQPDTAVLAVILIGACLAFLRHNFYPAKVFLGDAGSMYLGYLLAVISLYGTMKSATLFSIAVTLLAFGVPVFDTVQVMLSRLREGVSLYQADRRHVHHRLLKAGLTQQQAVYLLYIFSFLFSLLSIVLLLKNE